MMNLYGSQIMVWSRKYDSCIICGTTESEHDGKGICKRCHMKAHYWKNRERILEYSKQYRMKNKEKIRECNRRYYEANKEKIKLKQKAYRQKDKKSGRARERTHQYWLKNKEPLSEYRRNWRLQNIDKVKENNKRWRKTKSGRLSRIRAKLKRRGNGVLLPKGLIKRIIERDNGICQYCGIKCKPNGTDNNSITIDHIIPISKYQDYGLKNPNIKENLVVSCRYCNQVKGDREEFFLEKVEEIL